MIRTARVARRTGESDVVVEVGLDGAGPATV
jgi:imidazoleglycerol phosphate dehydratase HisB